MTKRYVFFISIASFLLTVIWIVSNVYHSYATSTIEPMLQIQIQEIAPTFDEETLSNLQDRTLIEPSEESIVPTQLTDDQTATAEAQDTETLELDEEILPPDIVEQPDIFPPEFEEPIQTEEDGILTEEGVIEE